MFLIMYHNSYILFFNMFYSNTFICDYNDANYMKMFDNKTNGKFLIIRFKFQTSYNLQCCIMRKKCA